MGARIHEMHNIRKELVRLFLSYRANNIQVISYCMISLYPFLMNLLFILAVLSSIHVGIQDRSLWASILDDEQTFNFTQPYLMYRHFQNNPPCEIKSSISSSASNSGSNSSVGSNSRSNSRSTTGSNSRSTAGTPSGATSGLHVRGSITPFRKNSGQVVVEGIDGMLVDCASLKLMVEGLGEGTQAWTDNLFR